MVATPTVNKDVFTESINPISGSLAMEGATREAAEPRLPESAVDTNEEEDAIHERARDIAGEKSMESITQHPTTASVTQELPYPHEQELTLPKHAGDMTTKENASSPESTRAVPLEKQASDNLKLPQESKPLKSGVTLLLPQVNPEMVTKDNIPHVTLPTSTSDVEEPHSEFPPQEEIELQEPKADHGTITQERIIDETLQDALEESESPPYLMQPDQDATMPAIDSEMAIDPPEVSGGISTYPASTPEPSISTSSISNAALEVDSNFDDYSDADSAISDMRAQSSTNSARSSVYDFVEENGRTFHRYKDGKYVLPNDEIEQDRLDLQHQMVLILLDQKLHLAPIKPDLQRVLDVGTGTGIWAIEFAQEYPSASVIGTDLSPIQPQFVPPNCQFEVDDAEDTWMYSKPFDYIHMRGMMTCFSNPRSILEKAFHSLVPGGYLEMQDSVFPMHCHDDTLSGTSLDIWGKMCVEAAAKIGRPWTNAPKYRRWMEEIGFEDVREKIFEVPTSTWPKGAKQKELGMWWHADLLQALGASMRVLTHGLGWQTAEVERLLVEVRIDIKNRGVHAFMPIHIVWGRKPGQPVDPMA